MLNVLLTPKTTPGSGGLWRRRWGVRPAWGLALVLPFLSVVARGDQDGDFEFQIVGAGAVITGYLGPGGAVVIPGLLGGQPVTPRSTASPA